MCVQPDLGPPSQAIKKCWTCDNRIPFSKGWCNACWEELGPDRQSLVLVVTSSQVSDFLKGSVFAAIDQEIQVQRASSTKKQVTLSIRPGVKKKIDLSTIDLGDIRI